MCVSTKCICILDYCDNYYFFLANADNPCQDLKIREPLDRTLYIIQTHGLFFFGEIK